MIEIKHKTTGAILFTHDGASLSGANLRNANLRNANLYGANLIGANLYGANLYGANLYGADLCGADLCGANLSGANLRGADLSDANLRNANLSDANLRNANLSDANLYGANLSDAKGLHSQKILADGELTVYKKTRQGVVTLKIPANAGRVHAWGSRKCRAEFAIVMATPGNAPALGMHDKRFAYVPGQRVTPDSYDPDPRVECSHGIHFFITREEAEEY